jgi:hypothetical protein
MDYSLMEYLGFLTDYVLWFYTPVYSPTTNKESGFPNEWHFLITKSLIIQYTPPLPNHRSSTHYYKIIKLIDENK